jgi:hypothetical protein
MTSLESPLFFISPPLFRAIMSNIAAMATSSDLRERRTVVADGLDELISLKKSQRMNAPNHEFDAERRLKLEKMAARGIRGPATEAVHKELALKRAAAFIKADYETQRDVDASAGQLDAVKVRELAKRTIGRFDNFDTTILQNLQAEGVHGVSSVHQIRDRIQALLLNLKQTAEIEALELEGE